MDHAYPEVYLGAAAERAPEVAPSNKPLLAHEDSDGLQVIEHTGQKEGFRRERHEPCDGALKNTDRTPRRRKMLIWLAVGVTTVIALTVAVSLGVHFGKQSRNASEELQTSSPLQSSHTTLSAATSKPSTLTTSIETPSTSTSILSRTMAAEPRHLCTLKANSDVSDRGIARRHYVLSQTVLMGIERCSGTLVVRMASGSAVSDDIPDA